MAHKKDYKPEDIMFPEQRIVQSELVHEMKSSYIDYAMSVIVGRALPDVRDGLKPVHRRILYAMYEDGLTSDKPFKKSATCVGDVLGRYHPHGDASVYDAMVRLAQDFSMRYPLVDGHGNFGSVDGDPPAAYRYTEARMSKLCNEMLRDIDKETVLWDPNFDESRKEPRVLPSRFPNLLVNGSSGIAVGMATNIPPHNLTEVINACICILENPEAELADLMDYIKGPDFPTKGIIMGRSGIRAAYATGRGKITVRARTEFEEFGQNRERIIVTELPYQVNKRQLIANMAEQVRDKRLEGISDIRDETDRNGMRVVIELKKDANPQVVLNRLFAQTQMQTTFGVTMLALVNNQQQPKILSLRHMLDEYLAFQEEIITKRTQYDLKKALDRQHVLEGLLIAEDNIDEVIKTIRESYDNAKERLMERFNLSEIQAQVVLDMQLKRLQGLEREKLEAEYAELEKRIEYYRELLSNEEMLKGVLKDELTAIRDKYGDDRLLRAYYDNMLRYADFMIRRAGKWGGIFAKPMHLSHKNRKYAVNCGKSYGEWAEPNDVMAFHGIDFFIPHPEESTAYTYFTLKRVLEIASILGKPETPQLARIREYSKGAKRAYQELVTKDGYSLDTDRQAKLVRPLYMGLLTPEQEAFARKRLIAALDHYGWRLGTGFLSTPMILDVLAGLDISYAYRLLENEEMPGWLFMPKSGATTIWEAWEGNQKDKWIASLNHYSKGAVCEWLMNTMCGIRITGENHVTIAPKPGGDITFARASYWSICGNVTTSWERTENGYRLTVGIPANTTAEILLPDGTGRTVGAGQHRYEWK